MEFTIDKLKEIAGRSPISFYELCRVLYPKLVHPERAIHRNIANDTLNYQTLRDLFGDAGTYPLYFRHRDVVAIYHRHRQICSMFDVSTGREVAAFIVPFTETLGDFMKTLNGHINMYYADDFDSHNKSKL